MSERQLGRIISENERKILLRIRVYNQKEDAYESYLTSQDKEKLDDSITELIKILEEDWVDKPKMTPLGPRVSAQLDASKRIH